MSTQSTLSIPFSITHPQGHIRLLELPPDLLAVVSATSSDGKAEHVYKQLGGRVQLKSAPTDESAPSTKPKEEFLHLCTEDKVWAVRQVSTSNSVHLVHPAKVPSGDDETTTTTTTTHEPGLTAFAQPTSTLELLPAPFKPGDIEAAIRRLLPSQDLHGNVPSSIVSEQDLVSSLPYPLHTILAAKRNLFVTSHPKAPMVINDTSSSENNKNNIYTAIPTPQLLLAAWKCFFSLKGFQVDSTDTIRLGEHLSTVERHEGATGEILACTIRAIAEKLVVWPTPENEEDDDGPSNGDVPKQHPELMRRLYSPKGKLKGRETSLFVGETLVRCAEGGRMEVSKLQELWVELVPERWSEFCRIGDLTMSCVVEGGGGVVSWHEDSNGSVGGGKVADAAAATVVPSKRNWHEKFAAQRKKN